VPELPEVEVVRAGLEPAVTDALIAGVEVFEPRSLRRHDVSRGAFAALLEGQRTTAAVRRGKFLWIPLAGAGTEPELALVVHLGMSGQVLLRDPGSAADYQLRIRLQLDHPQLGELWLNFVDQRIFGSMFVDALVPTADGLAAGRGSPLAAVPSLVAHIARDPLDPAFDDELFISTLLRKNTGIKRSLLDQGLMSGVGNIYADEALWASKTHYAKPGVSFTPAKARRVLHEVRLVLSKALAEGGTSFDAQYVNVNGASGYFAHSLNVYGQQGKPCGRCGTTLVREAFMNRSSHFCPTCQRAVR
jgi:formamidopyrimidine-DNA glycosylase